MKHISGYTQTLISSLLARFRLMSDSWGQSDDRKLSNLIQEEISSLDEKIKNLEIKLESTKLRRDKLRSEYLEYRKEYRNKNK